PPLQGHTLFVRNRDRRSYTHCVHPFLLPRKTQYKSYNCNYLSNTTLAVVTLHPGMQGRHYRLPTERDYQAVWNAQKQLQTVVNECESGGKKEICPVPNDPTPAGGGSGAGRAFSVQKYGMMRFSDLFTARQKMALTTFARHVASRPQGRCKDLLGLLIDRAVDFWISLARWKADAECPVQALARQALPIVWDFAEAVPLSDSTGSLLNQVDRMGAAILSATFPTMRPGSLQQADACDSPLPNESTGVWFTDPPYYDAIPYADLSDLFFVWLKRTLPGHSFLRDPFDASNLLTPKTREVVQDETRQFNGLPKDRVFFEGAMARAFAEGRRVLREDGIGCVVFAHKTTEGWEALLSGMIRGGWVITGSWPISTESRTRLRARDSAALATSVHLICRARRDDAPVADWGAVLRELPKRVGDWMERLQSEGVRGADLVFACIGPALEIYSKYSKVEDAEGREIPLGGDPETVDPHQRGFLAYVWETVGRLALEQVLGTAEAKARNGATGAVEEDARLTALFLWTLQSTNGHNGNTGQEADDAEEEVEEADEHDEETASRKMTKGFSLV
ncbi:MAG TPA: hypothetical protein VLH56_16465, partial [Dissulfurispiraceae bacterium]|nr:hypothetical protein [Dissulfurispiraceae bacterium]